MYKAISQKVKDKEQEKRVRKQQKKVGSFESSHDIQNLQQLGLSSKGFSFLQNRETENKNLNAFLPYLFSNK